MEKPTLFQRLCWRRWKCPRRMHLAGYRDAARRSPPARGAVPF